MTSVIWVLALIPIYHQDEVLSHPRFSPLFATRQVADGALVDSEAVQPGLSRKSCGRCHVFSQNSPER